MKITSKFAIIGGVSLVGIVTFAFSADHPAVGVGADEALTRLKSGNARFVNAQVSEGKPVAARRAETAQAQHPFVAQFCSKKLSDRRSNHENGSRACAEKSGSER